MFDISLSNKVFIILVQHLFTKVILQLLFMKILKIININFLNCIQLPRISFFYIYSREGEISREIERLSIYARVPIGPKQIDKPLIKHFWSLFIKSQKNTIALKALRFKKFIRIYRLFILKVYFLAEKQNLGKWVKVPLFFFNL